MAAARSGDRKDLAATGRRTLLVVLLAVAILSLANSSACAVDRILVSPGSLHFGIQRVNTQDTERVEITNNSPKILAPAQITVQVHSESGAFREAPSSCPKLEPGERCLLRVAFAPDRAGPFRGTLDVAISHLYPQRVSLSGTGGD